MRILPALMLFVYLAPCCHAGDWTDLHASGVEATKNRQFDTAVALLRRSWDAAQNPTQKAISANDLGIVLYRSAHGPEARVWLERAVELWRADPATAVRCAETSAALTLVDRMLGDYAAAESVLRNALGSPSLPPRSQNTLLCSLGDLMREEGNFGEARQLLTQAEAIPESTPIQQLNTAVALAELDRDTHNWDAGADRWNRTAELARQRQEPGIEAACIRGLGETWLDQGNLARAEPLLKKALALYTAPPLNDDSQTGTILTSLGQLYMLQDKNSLAEDALNRALACDERSLGPAHPQIALVLELLADNLARVNRIELARTYFERAESILTGRFGASSLMAASVSVNWGLVEERSGNLARAGELYRKAIDAIGSGPDRDVYRGRVMTGYARVLKSTNHKREAAALLAQAQNLLPPERIGRNDTMK